MSLRLRAMLILGSIEAATMMVLVVASLTYLHRTGLNQAQQHAEDALRLIRAAVAESLFVVNEHSAAEVIDSAFYEIPDISYLQIIGEDGKMLAEKRKGSDLTGRSLYLHDSIELGGVEFGQLHMHWSTAAVTASVQRQSGLLGAFAALGLAVSGLVTWFAMGKLGDLLATMETGLRELSCATPTEPLPVPPGQELGRLVSAYNHLIERLHPS